MSFCLTPSAPPEHSHPGFPAILPISLQGAFFGLITPLLQKADPLISDSAIFSVLLIGPVTGLLVQPFFGALSDEVC